MNFKLVGRWFFFYSVIVLLYYWDNCKQSEEYNVERCYRSNRASFSWYQPDKNNFFFYSELKAVNDRMLVVLDENVADKKSLTKTACGFEMVPWKYFSLNGVASKNPGIAPKQKAIKECQEFCYVVILYRLFDKYNNKKVRESLYMSALKNVYLLTLFQLIILRIIILKVYKKLQIYNK